jgi:CopG family transcriptional regulator, nickel-responsive regulator
MQRITIAIDDGLLDAVDALMRRHQYASRSEVFRDLVRDRVGQDAASAPDQPCVAALTYVYDHATRELAQRLTATQHSHHDLTVANMHVHLDHGACLEVSVLRGEAAAVRHLADELTSQRGVRHAALHVVPVEVSLERHAHGGTAAPHTHLRA